MNKTHLNNWQIWNMSIGLLGINFGWGLQMANMSAIYEYLGAKPSNIPILWLAAPLTGLLVQPIIGHMSDRTWGPLGRRKPYFLTGAILASLAIIAMPLSTTIWMAAIALWVLDASVNISMGPFRALVPDILPDSQCTKGYIFQGIAIAAGTVSASAMPWLLQHVFHLSAHAHHGTIPDIVKYSFWIGAAVFMGTILWTIVSTKEYPPKELHVIGHQPRAKGIKNSIREIWQDILTMPQTMRDLAWVMIFSWMGLFCMYLFFPIAVANRIFNATPGSPNYLTGLEWAGVCFAAYSVFFLLFSFMLPFLSKSMSNKSIYRICLFIGGIALSSITLVHNHLNLLWIMLGVGICYAGMQSMPYAILAKALPKEKMGIYMGIFNLFIVIPEILIALIFGLIMKHWLHNNRELGVMFGGIFILIAGFLTWKIKEVIAVENESRNETR